MANKKSLRRRLGLATVAFGVVTYFGMQDLVVNSDPIRDEYYSIARDLRDVRNKLSHQYTLEEFITDCNTIGLVNEAENLISREKSLKIKKDRIENSQEYRDASRRHTIKSAVYSIPLLGFVLSSLGFRIATMLSSQDKKG